MCTNYMGKADAMSPQEQLRYKEAMPSELNIPTPQVVSRRNESYIPPAGATVKMQDGRMITKDSNRKLQQMLKNRGT